MSSSAKSAARSAEGSTAFRALARGGYAANGVVHALVGGIAVSIGLTGRGDSDQTSALSSLAGNPLGSLSLWVLTALLAALGIFHLLDGWTQSRADSTKKWGVRLSRWGQGAVFLLTGAVAAFTALGRRGDGDATAENASRGLLDVPGGPVVLAVIGLGLLVGGLVFMAMGSLRSFRTRMSLPAGALGTAVSALGVIGFVAKGATVSVIGVLIGLAGLQDDPSEAGALDSAVQTLRDIPGGTAIVLTLGLGLIAYGAFCGFRARFARL
ncbi:DUF1206 domain-containing protein [Brevibacterium album]|uniref:DUF1206 domain-containing protein n=1 Tax=Brevibacterium album TaxID=417948 RepID=UPI00048A9C58|nr:DUF1206 domain-containing protein [Brevibacterium album]